MVERGERLGGGVLERREGLMKYVYHSSSPLLAAIIVLPFKFEAHGVCSCVLQYTVCACVLQYTVCACLLLNPLTTVARPTARSISCVISGPHHLHRD
jgi:hypothetical protein